MDVRRVDLSNWALRTSQKFTKGGNISSIRVFDQIRDPEIPITLHPHYVDNVKEFTCLGILNAKADGALEDDKNRIGLMKANGAFVQLYPI